MDTQNKTQREIKFRAWDKKRRGWLEYIPFEVTPSLRGEGWSEELKLNPHKIRFPDFVEVNLFTGLKDKNGKEIYEGDILHTPGDGDSFVDQTVVWHDYKYVGIHRYDVSKVIGNIYEGLRNTGK